MMAENDLIKRGDAIAAVRYADADCRGANGACENLRSIQAVQPTVKPLVWDGDEWGRIAGNPWGSYAIIDCDGPDPDVDYYGWCHSDRTDNDRSAETYPTLEAAKAAAQADYEARILSAITTGKEVMHNDEGNSNARPATSPGVTAGAVSPDVAALDLAGLRDIYKSTPDIPGLPNVYQPRTLAAAIDVAIAARVKGVM